MLRDLEWLGFEWDAPPLRQSEQFDRYRSVLDELFDEGLLYPAILSRREIREQVALREEREGHWPNDPDGVPLYPGDERETTLQQRLAVMRAGTSYALRLDTQKALERTGSIPAWQETGSGPEGETGAIVSDPADWGDVVLARKDTPASFHLCVTLDDAYQGVTHVVRGRDLFWSTSVHRLLQDLLGLAVPRYHHHQLILDTDGRKLSKSRGDTALAHLREAGLTPGDIRRMIGLDG